MVDNIKERLIVLFPDITINFPIEKPDCDVLEGKITKWNRPEKQPTVPELNAVSQAQVDAVKAAAAAAEQAILTKKEIAEFKKVSPELVAILKDSDQKIIDDVLLETSGSSNAEIVAGIREAQAKTRMMLRDLANAVKAMVT